MGQDVNLAWKSAVFKCWLCFRLFLWRTQNNFPIWFRSSFKNASIKNDSKMLSKFYCYLPNPDDQFPMLYFLLPFVTVWIIVINFSDLFIELVWRNFLQTYSKECTIFSKISLFFCSDSLLKKGWAVISNNQIKVGVLVKHNRSALGTWYNRGHKFMKLSLVLICHK